MIFVTKLDINCSNIILLTKGGKLNKLALIWSLAMFLGATGIAGATPICFDLAGSIRGSCENTTGQQALIGNKHLNGRLASTLDRQIFTLSDNQTLPVDFYTLTASGLWIEPYDITANLISIAPSIGLASGPVSGIVGTSIIPLIGHVSGGILSCNSTTLSDLFTNLDGNTVKVDLGGGLAIGLGNTTMVQAVIMNKGGGAAPVPEPGTILLLGGGLVGIFTLSRRRMKR
jgi:PEP-CTERM motif